MFFIFIIIISLSQQADYVIEIAWKYDSGLIVLNVIVFDVTTFALAPVIKLRNIDKLQSVYNAVEECGKDDLRSSNGYGERCHSALPY
jgi:hypothetical protein